MNSKFPFFPFLLLPLACTGPAHAANEAPPADTEQPDAYRLQMQERLQSMTAEERALFQSMNQLRNGSRNRPEDTAGSKGKKGGNRDGSGRKFRHGRNGAHEKRGDREHI